RASLAFVDAQRTVGCGENHPLTANAIENRQSQIDRRVEVLFFDPGEEPKLDCHPAKGKCVADACEIYRKKLFKLQPIPCTPIVPPPPSKPRTVAFTKIETSDPVEAGKAPVFRADDDFSPRLGERTKVTVHVEELASGVAATVRVDFGRLTKKADDPATADKNEGFALVARVDESVTGTDAPLDVEVEWDGKATEAVGQQFAARTTRDNVAAKDVNVPMLAIAKGDPISHGLYVIDQITLLEGTAEVAKTRPAAIDLSVPQLVNLVFNANWPGTLDIFGLRAFQPEIEQGLPLFITRDYMVRDPTPANRSDVRVLRGAALDNKQSIVASVGGTRADALFGSTPDGPAPLSDNLYAFHTGIAADVSIFPGSFILINNTNIAPGDVTLFRTIFQPLGVRTTQTPAAPGTASPRAVDAAGAVTGACDATDRGNVTV
ncbi:MAG: hypothetical protein ACREKH_10755, partial [Candidatus Rokuibacteriota bacterium]